MPRDEVSAGGPLDTRPGEGPRGLRLVWVGSHAEGIPAFAGVLEAGYNVAALLTLTAEAATRRSAAVDYRPLAEQHGVPVIEVEHIDEPAALRHLHTLQPDVLFVIGWSQLLTRETLATARIGAVGAHASLLPRNRGSAPINWAIINGETQTGNSLIWLTPEVDTGDVIEQTAFPITPFDTCATLYQKVAETNRDMILRLLAELAAGRRPGRPQTVGGPVLPRRRPADGEIDWRWSGSRVYDFVRALTRPYPGAFSHLGDRRWSVWSCALLPGRCGIAAEPGQVLGSVVSPEPNACGQAVVCGDGRLVVLLDVEDDEGLRLAGHELATQPWEGMIWRAG